SQLFVDHGLPKEDVSSSGYWRLGMGEDEWQASKREFTEEIEAAEAAALES
ncbi:MAG: siderophore-interacting protein, partial [Corynebacterium variabile]|nr:siderophore-interacting protein [Corynebacterium variabile]